MPPGVYKGQNPRSFLDEERLTFGDADDASFRWNGTSLVVTGLMTFDSVLTPTADDGVALGTSSLQWSDLFLASGGVINFNGSDVTLTHASNLLTLAGGGLVISTVGLSITAGGLTLGTGANKLGLGAAEAVTIASGVATITKPYVKLTGQDASADQLDTITYTGAAEGDILILTQSSQTITVDDANIDLGDTTRVLSAVGHYLFLIFDGSSWGEIAFIQGNNA